MRSSACFVLCLSCALAVGAEKETKTDGVFKAYAAPGSPGCAVGVMQGGKTLYAKGYGLADLEQQIALTPKSVFYMGSVSKQFMALSVLLLEKQGKLSLDDSIRKHVAELPDYFAPVTLRQLLHHTSGVRDYLTLGLLAGYSQDHVWTERAALKSIARQKSLNFEPGAEHLYSNSGYVLLSLAAQRAAGERLNEWGRKNLFEPRGMASTRWQHDHADPVPRRAHGYVRSMLGAWKIADSMLDTIGGGGLYSSVEDMLQWAAGFEGGASDAHLLARMAEPGKLIGGQPISNGYGMGLVRGEYRGTPMISHGGALAGYRTHFLRLPEKSLAVVCLCNVGNSIPQRLAEQVVDVWLEGDLGEVSRAQGPKPPVPPKLASPDEGLTSAITGEWWSDELQAVYRFRLESGQLMVEVGDNTRAAVMASEDGKLRVSMMPIAFSLQRDGGGSVASMTLEAGRVRGIELRRR